MQINQNIKIIILIILLLTTLLFNDFIKSETMAATNGDYNRVLPGGGISIIDWNNLDEDFLEREGGSVEGGIDINNNSVKNLFLDSTDSGNLATIAYVDGLIEASQGGDTYINWGRANCPNDDIVMYGGYGFSNRIGNVSGGSNPVCIDVPQVSLNFLGTYSDSLKPLITASEGIFPSGIPERTHVKCAVCYKKNSTCFMYSGGNDCSSFGFQSAYIGHLMSERSEMNRNSLNRACLSDDFDNTAEFAISSFGAKWYSSRVKDNFDQAIYPNCETNGQCNFVKCAVCCK